MAVDVTLADLGLDSLMGVEVKQTLERDYELVLPMKEIRLLTMARLAEIAGGGGGGGGEPATATVAAADGGSPERLNDSGVSVRYDLSQLMPTASLVRMNETGGDAPPLFVVHSIQGSVASLDAVMALVTRDVYGLQCTADAPMGSVPQLATFYLQVGGPSMWWGGQHGRGCGLVGVMGGQRGWVSGCVAVRVCNVLCVYVYVYMHCSTCVHVLCSACAVRPAVRAPPTRRLLVRAVRVRVLLCMLCVAVRARRPADRAPPPRRLLVRRVPRLRDGAPAAGR